MLGAQPPSALRAPDAMGHRAYRKVSSESFTNRSLLTTTRGHRKTRCHSGQKEHEMHLQEHTAGSCKTRKW